MHIPGRTRTSVAALVALTFAAATSVSYADPKDTIDSSRIQQGFAASPIPKEDLNLKGKDQAQVALGSYLTFAGDCVGCHSFPRFLFPGGPGSNPAVGDPFSPPLLGGAAQTVNGQLKANFNTLHYMAGGRCFGPIQARNLTPDDSGRPRGLTEDEFIRAMRTGEDVSCQTKASNIPVYFKQPDGVCALNLASRGKPLGAPSSYDPNKLQTMAWVTYHNLTDNDLKAIYAYLSALPEATACNTAANGCPGFSTPIDANTGKPSASYAYTGTAECPNPPPPQ